MKKIIALIVTVCLVTLSFAQTDSLSRHAPKNSLLFDVGLVEHRLIDEGYTFSKLMFRGINPKIGLAYGRETNHYIFTLSLEVSAGKVWSKSGNLPSDLLNVKPAVEYLRKINQYRLLGTRNTLFAGIQASSNNFVINNQPIINNSDVVSQHGIFFSLSNTLALGKSQLLRVSYLLPLVVSVNRVINSGTDLTTQDYNRPLKLLFSHQNISYFSLSSLIQLKVAYEKKLSRHASFTARYNFFYAKSAFDAPVHIYSNAVSLGLKFSF